jgi:hypothetical protein
MRHAACAACNMHQYRSGYTYARVKPRELNRQDNSLFERLFRRCSASAYRKPTTDVARAAQVCAKSRCEAQSATTRRGLLTHARCALGVARCKLHAVATRLRARPRLPTSRWASSSRSTTRGSLKRKARRGRQRSSSSARQSDGDARGAHASMQRLRACGTLFSQRRRRRRPSGRRPPSPAALMYGHVRHTHSDEPSCMSYRLLLLLFEHN